jgi:hypothetical protein
MQEIAANITFLSFINACGAFKSHSWELCEPRPRYSRATPSFPAPLDRCAGHSGRTFLKASIKSALVLTTAAAIALTCLDLRPAVAAPEGGAAIVKQGTGADEFSAAQKKRRRARGVNPAIPLAAFGAIIGTIGTIAAEQRRRDYYERYYDGPYEGGYVYRQPRVYHQPYSAPAPVYRHYGQGPRGNLGGRPYDYGPRGYLGPGANPQLGNPAGGDRTPP